MTVTHLTPSDLVLQQHALFQTVALLGPWQQQQVRQEVHIGTHGKSAQLSEQLKSAAGRQQGTGKPQQQVRAAPRNQQQLQVISLSSSTAATHLNVARKAAPGMDTTTTTTSSSAIRNPVEHQQEPAAKDNLISDESPGSSTVQEEDTQKPLSARSVAETNQQTVKPEASGSQSPVKVVKVPKVRQYACDKRSNTGLPRQKLLTVTS